MKIDVEGVEDEVLLGGLELLKRNPVMIIELNQGMKASASKAELNSLGRDKKGIRLKSKIESPLVELISLGYKCFWLDERESLVTVNSIDFLPHHEKLGENCGANYLFIPKGFILPRRLRRLIK